MYPVLLSLHSFFRWMVLASLCFSIYTAYRGMSGGKPFSNAVNSLRHWTATIAHIQLVIGITIYFQSPVVQHSMPDNPHKLINEQTFFRYVHLSMMMLAVVIITIGSAKAKRMENDRQKYQTMLRWFIAGLIIILAAIPWPFSPLAGRPLLRSF